MEDCEHKYFSDAELISIEDYTSLAVAGKQRQLVVSIMEFLNAKGYLTAKQKNTVLSIVKQWTVEQSNHLYTM